MTADHKSEACCSHTAADTEPLSSQEPAQKVCSCCAKHTLRSEAERKKLVNRLKRIEGQIRGIIGMLENDAYCNDILSCSLQLIQHGNCGRQQREIMSPGSTGVMSALTYKRSGNDTTHAVFSL